MIDLVEVRSRADLERFVAFPERLYRRHPCYVPKLVGEELRTLRQDRNPAFEYCEARYWMAVKDGVPAGRVAGIISRRYIETWKRRRVRFGWLDFVDDAAVAAALLSAVEDWGRSRGLDEAHGPLGFCDFDRQGMLVEGFDELDVLTTSYNFPYYPAHLERLGYVKDVDWLEYLVAVPNAIPDRVDRIARAAVERLGLRVLRTRRRRDLEPYISEVFALINESYEALYSVVPLSEAQVRFYTEAFFGYLDHEYVKLVLDPAGRVAAFGVSMPSLSRALQKNRGRLFPFGFIPVLRALRSNDRLDLVLTAVRPEFQNKGLGAVLMLETWKTAVARGIRYAEAGPQLESNAKVRAQWGNFDSRQHRRRRCYVKAL
jgi:GNAT superfamily N-acetyltransferase